MIALLLSHARPLRRFDWLGISLLIIWLLLLAPLPLAAHVPMHAITGLAFLALVIAPGYWLSDLLVRHLDIDILEKLALAFPVGIAILGVPGTLGLLNHWTIDQLHVAWAATALAVGGPWLVMRWRVASQATSRETWRAAHLLHAALLGGALAAVMPLLMLQKIDGDAFAVGSFVADALSGMPLNQGEPLFGTDIGAGVRMLFNQHLTLNYLWIRLAGVDPIAHAAGGARPALAVWAILAAYTLGRGAANGKRTAGLTVASVQLLVFLAAPFVRGDNISIFFFERIDADKFMVPTLMLPVVFGLVLRAMQRSDDAAASRRLWLTAAIGTFAVSIIHPLIAAMMALALGALAATHVLARPLDRPTWIRAIWLGGLIAVVMALPVVQLFVARGAEPLAASYPATFDGWSIGTRHIPALPFVDMPLLDWVGPVPRLAELDPAAAESDANPFLIWRFALNMERRRLVLFDLDRYIADPSLILEPPYLLALLLLPFFVPRLRRSVAAQFTVGVSAAILLVMYQPQITPLIGEFVMPWILWRFVWLLPFALAIGLPLHSVATRLARAVHLRLAPRAAGARTFTRVDAAGVLIASLIVTAAAGPLIRANIRLLHERVAFPVVYPTPLRLYERLSADIPIEAPAMVLAEPDVSVTLAAYVAQANILAHRVPTTSEIFPADRQAEALQRLIDQNAFFRTPVLTSDALDVLTQYDVKYVIVPDDGTLDLQMRLATAWFQWLAHDNGFALFAVDTAALAVRDDDPIGRQLLLANEALVARDWKRAQSLFDGVLALDPGNRLAQAGLFEVAHALGRFPEAVTQINLLLEDVELPILYFRLGQLHSELGNSQGSLTAFARAQAGTPRGARFHIALADACRRAGDMACATRQLTAAVRDTDYPDEAARLAALGDLWQERGETELAADAYLAAVDLRPSSYYLYQLASVYRDLGQNDDVNAVIARMKAADRFSAEPLLFEADIRARQGNIGAAEALYRRAATLQRWRLEDPTETYLQLAQVLYLAERYDDAALALAEAERRQPDHAGLHLLRGDLAYSAGDTNAALLAYETAFALDPGQTDTYLALSSMLRGRGSLPETVLAYLETAVQAENRDATLLLALGDLRQRIGHAEGAVEAYQFALSQLNPYADRSGERTTLPGVGRAFAYTRLAGALEDAADGAEALNYYRAAAATAPEAAWTHLLYGDALRRQGAFGAAERAYRESLAADPTYGDAYDRLADLLHALGRPAEAASLLDDRPTATTAPPPPASSRDLLAFSDWRRRALAGSDETLFDQTPRTAPDVTISAFTEALTVAEAIELGLPDSSIARLYLPIGEAQMASNDYVGAALTYAEAVQRDPWWVEGRLNLAEALTRLGDDGAALEALETAVLMAPGYVEAQLALANALQRAGDGPAALEIYERTAAAHPGDGRATLALARAWQERGRWDLAEETYAATLAVNPGSADAYVGLAEIALDRRELGEAADLLNSALVRDRRNIATYVRLGELEQRLGNAPAALHWYQQAAQLPAADQTLNLTLIDSLMRFGDRTTAREYTETALAQQPRNAELLLRLARLERIEGEFAAAEAALVNAARRAPDNERIPLEQAALATARGKPEGAIAAYELAIAINPSEESTYIVAAQLYAQQGQFTHALALLSSGLNEVNRPEALFTAMATLQLQQGEPDYALETLRTGLRQLGEQNTGMLLALGDYFASRAAFDQVESRYNQALEGETDIAAVQIALGNLYLLEGDYPAAVDRFEAAIQADPTTPGHYLALAEAHETAGEWAEAEVAYQQALSMAPTLTQAYLELAELFESQAQWEDAADVYRAGLDRMPASGPLLLAFARHHYAQGNTEQTRQLLDDALAVAPTAATHIGRAALMTDMGDEAAAKLELLAAIALEPGSIEGLIALGDLYRAEGDDASAREMYLQATEVMPGVPTGYLRLGQMAAEVFDRENALRYSDLAREAEPGSLVRPPDSE